MERIGLYGGTFAPPHLGHVHAVQSFLAQIPVEKLLIMPTGTPPHKVKAAGDTPQVRLEMCRAAFGDIPGVEISDYEITKGDVSYTVETLRYLTSPGRQIFLLCGTDMFLTLDRWFQAWDIFALAEIVCVARTADKEEEVRLTGERYRREYGKNCLFLTGEVLELSSTDIRDAIKSGTTLTKFVPVGVEEVIRRDRLYQ